ncbi:MAG TPA: archaeosortase/exosortase family protein [Burkholderiaceae bacterium]|nr:archaeosortase/exosortase family protein [Burkholderiaceae bacterium]
MVQATTAAPAAALLRWLEPALPTHANGAHLQWLGGQLALLAGCDGADLLLLYLPVTMIAPTSWPRRGLLAACGTVAIWLLNQVRVVVLVQMYRRSHGAFDAAHTVWAPLALALLVALLYGWLLQTWRTNP